MVAGALEVEVRNSFLQDGDSIVALLNGSMAMYECTLRRNRVAMVVSGGHASIRRSTFRDNTVAALRVEGGDVTLANETVFLGSPIALVVNQAAAVRYVLPAPLGRYVFIVDGSNVKAQETGTYRNDYPLSCSAGVVGDL